MVKLNLQVKNKVVTTNKTYRDYYITKKTKAGKKGKITRKELLTTLNKITKKYAQKIEYTELKGFTTSINAMTITGNITLGAYIPFNKEFKEYKEGDLYQEFDDYLEGKIKDDIEFKKAYDVTITIAYKTLK